MKIRLKKLVEWTTTLDYVFATADGKVMAYDRDLKAVSHEDYKNGAAVKSRKFEKGTQWVDIDIDEKELNILKIHAQIKSKWSNPNLTQALYEMVNIGEEQDLKVKKLKEMYRVMSIVNNLSIKSIYNLCHYLQMDINGRDINEIYILLLDPTKGFAYQNYDKVVNLEQDSDAMLTITVNKGIILGIITQQGKDYFYGDRMVAGSLSELYYYFKTSEDLFQKGLKKAVEAQEVDLPISVQYKENFEGARELFSEMAQSKKEIETITPDQLEWAKEMAKDLDIKGRGVMKPETLINAVLEREGMLLKWAQEKEKRKAERLAAK